MKKSKSFQLFFDLEIFWAFSVDPNKCYVFREIENIKGIFIWAFQLWEKERQFSRIKIYLDLDEKYGEE